MNWQGSSGLSGASENVEGWQPYLRNPATGARTWAVPGQVGLEHRIGGLPDVKRASGFDYLRTVAISRLMLDNIRNIQASWLTQGPKIGQIALQYGVNDMGSTVIEENVVTVEGAVFMVPLAEIERLIRDAGLCPARRNTKYEILDVAASTRPAATFPNSVPSV